MKTIKFLNSENNSLKQCNEKTQAFNSDVCIRTNMAAQLTNHFCCTKYCWDFYEKNSIVN